MRHSFAQKLLLLVFCVAFSACSKEPAPPPHQSFQISSTLLSERRTVNVYSPEDVTNDSPILLMLDGGIKEDFPHVAKSVKSAIESGRIRAILLIGIENTQRRRDMTGPTTNAKDKKIAPVVGGSATFRDFIKSELLPEITRRYGDQREISIIGESAAGLFIVENFFQDPTMFSNYVAVSPSLWWNNAYLARPNGSPAPTIAKPVALHVFAANETDIVPHVRNLETKLRATASQQLTLSVEVHPELTHQTVYRNVLPGILDRLYKK